MRLPLAVMAAGLLILLCQSFLGGRPPSHGVAGWTEQEHQEFDELQLQAHRTPTAGPRAVDVTKIYARIDALDEHRKESVARAASIKKWARWGGVLLLLGGIVAFVGIRVTEEE